MSTYEGPVVTCALCEQRYTAEAIWQHLRDIHDWDEEVETWPDGRPIIVDETLTPDSFQHSISPFETLREYVNFHGASPAVLAAIRGIEEQFEALRLAATRQLTPLDVAATHIDILRRKSEDYTPQERDNVAAIVESHVKEARTALFAAISNPASEPVEPLYGYRGDAS